jgi:hypothetical protein
VTSARCDDVAVGDMSSPCTAPGDTRVSLKFDVCRQKLNGAS